MALFQYISNYGIKNMHTFFMKKWYIYKIINYNILYSF